MIVEKVRHDSAASCLHDVAIKEDDLQLNCVENCNFKN